MAIAGYPARNIPCRIRKGNIIVKLSVKAMMPVKMVEPIREILIIVFLPNLSEREGVTSIATARLAVAVEIDKLAVAGEMENSEEKIGISG